MVGFVVRLRITNLGDLGPESFGFRTSLVDLGSQVPGLGQIRGTWGHKVSGLGQIWGLRVTKFRV